MATPAMTTPHNVAVLCQKLYDADSDLRYMSLADLSTVFTSSNSAFLTHDYNLCAKIVDGFLHTLNDPNGEVQNMAIKCLGSFVISGKVNPEIIRPMIHKIANLTTDNTIDSSIAATAVRAIVVSLPRPSPGVARTKSVLESYQAISQVLIPRLVGYLVVSHSEKGRPPVPRGLLEDDLEKGTDSNSMDVLIEVAKCFGPMLQKAEVTALGKISSQMLEAPRTGSVMKKKAITALSVLAQYYSDAALSQFLSGIIEKLTTPHITPTQQKLYINLLGSMARSIPKHFGNHLKMLAPFVLAVLNPQELDKQMENGEEEERDPQVDEVKEAALVALDGFTTFCREEMERFSDECINAALVYLTYDPNVAGGGEDYEESEDEEDEDNEFEMDDDFEEEGGADDEDDLSWKARRCAAKLLDTIISVRGKDLLENSAKYEKIALTLISRFKEREETVRLEILATLSHLIRKTGEGEVLESNVTSIADQNLTSNIPSRKRRRGVSDADVADVTKFRRVTGSTSPAGSPPREGPPATLEKISPELIKSTLSLFNKHATINTKQAVVALLRDLVIARHGGFDNDMNTLLDPLLTSIKMADGQHSSYAGGIQGGVSGNTLRISALSLLSEVLKTHSSNALQAYMSKIVPTVIEAMETKHPKVSCQASETAEQIVKALTPPRSASTNKSSQGQVTALLDAATSLSTARDGDIEVRKSAIRNLGLILGRCSSKAAGPQLISSTQQSITLELLWDTLKNETTRLASIRAIDNVGFLTSEKGYFTPDWFSKVCLELGAQLRKSSRSLRNSSLKALHTLLNDSRCVLLDAKSTKELSTLLLPLLASSDLQLLTPVIHIYTVLMGTHASSIVDEEFNTQLCTMMITSIAISALEDLCSLARAIAEQGVAQSLMQRLLKDGITGNPIVVGKVIGNLVVSGGGNVGVTVDDFRKELESSSDPQRKQLALSVLGEVGLRSGSSSTLSPTLFIHYFSSSSDKVKLAAATALGRAATGTGNVQTYVPTILGRIQENPEEQYIVLHAIEEILRNENVAAELAPYTKSLWDASISASQTDDNRTIGAECVANLVLMEPKRFLPALHALLGERGDSTRGLAIAAFRDVFAGSDVSYDKELRPIIVEVLTTMLRDSELENRRAALNAFNAAARSKPDLVFPNIRQLFPLVVEQTFEDPSLIREESVGPFKHRVDDGLQVRKGAYETLYSMMEIALSRIDLVQLYDRVVAGVGDEHDIRTLCNLMITKLLVSAPEETHRRLDAISDQFRGVLGITLKETAVKQEHEKTDESKRGVVKVSIELNTAFSSSESGATGTSPGANWTSYWDWLRKEHQHLYKEIKEAKDKERL